MWKWMGVLVAVVVLSPGCTDESSDSAGATSPRIAVSFINESVAVASDGGTDWSENQCVRVERGRLPFSVTILAKDPGGIDEIVIAPSGASAEVRSVGPNTASVSTSPSGDLIVIDVPVPSTGEAQISVLAHVEVTPLAEPFSLLVSARDVFRDPTDFSFAVHQWPPAGVGRPTCVNES